MDMLDTILLVIILLLQIAQLYVRVRKVKRETAQAQKKAEVDDYIISTSSVNNIRRIMSGEK